MAQGRGNAYAAAMLVVLHSCSLWLQASAATYTVGGSKGWTLGVDYTTWATGLTFKAGDILFFPYSPAEHNVVVVDKAGYDACSEANGTTYSDGNTNVTLTGTGLHYYLCSVIGHCSGGMKLAITVTATAVPPPASPPASAPAPSITTPSSPITTPSTAPSPPSPPSSAPTPSSPAPAPSAETPASIPSPSSPAPGTPISTPSAPGSSPSTTGTPPSSPPPPNAAPSLLVSATFAPVLTLFAALFAL